MHEKLARVLDRPFKVCGPLVTQARFRQPRPDRLQRAAHAWVRNAHGQLDISVVPGKHATEAESTSRAVARVRLVVSTPGWPLTPCVVSVTRGRGRLAVNKQVNDKERVAAALENPSLRPIVEDCIRDPVGY